MIMYDWKHERFQLEKSKNGKWNKKTKTKKMNMKWSEEHSLSVERKEGTNEKEKENEKEVFPKEKMIE